MIEITLGDYTLDCSDSDPPRTDWFLAHAALIDTLDRTADDDHLFFLAVSHTIRGVLLATLIPTPQPSGSPGILLDPDASRLFVGAGDTTLCYDLSTPRRLWRDNVDPGFWCWIRHADGVLMQAEFELAGYNRLGERLWMAFIDPPADVEVRDGQVYVRGDSVPENLREPFCAMQGPRTR